MTKSRLILHVGAPKCASSSLQAALSRRPEFISRHGERFRYAAITNECEIVTGEVLRQRAASVACRYVVSANAQNIIQYDESQIVGLAQRLEDMLRDSSVILSCESWIDTAEIFQTMNLLGRIAFDTEIVAYVRPQADFLNACWWQWGAWSDVDFELWLYFSGFGNTCAWARFMRAWSTVRGVTSVSPRLLSKDVVTGFFDSLDCDHDDAGRSNRSLPGVALRFLQRHRDLRPGMHDSEIDFILERALGNWAEPAPWILPIDYVATFIGQCKAENTYLLAMLTEADRAAMLADLRWWDVSPYRERPVVSPDVADTSAQELDVFAAALATALRNAEREVAVLRSDKLKLEQLIAPCRTTAC